MAIEAVERWALINSYTDEEVDYNLTQWHKVDKQVFSGAYERLLAIAKPECQTCPQVGFLALSAAKGRFDIAEAEGVLSEIQSGCEGVRVFHDRDPIDGDQFFTSCPEREEFVNTNKMSW